MNLTNPNAEWILHQTNIDVIHQSNLGKLAYFKGMVYYVDFINKHRTTIFSSNGPNFTVWNPIKVKGASSHGLTENSISIPNKFANCWTCEKCMVYLWIERLHIFVNYD